MPVTTSANPERIEQAAAESITLSSQPTTTTTSPVRPATHPKVAIQAEAIGVGQLGQGAPHLKHKSCTGRTAARVRKAEGLASEQHIHGWQSWSNLRVEIVHSF